jgi:hypothetical protein
MDASESADPLGGSSGRAAAVKKELFWYSHRYQGSRDNLRRAHYRLLELRRLWATSHPERVLWAPWLEMAAGGVAEQKAMNACLLFVRLGAGIVVDIDSHAISTGMRDERDEAVAACLQVVTVDGEDMDEVSG